MIWSTAKPITIFDFVKTAVETGLFASINYLKYIQPQIQTQQLVWITYPPPLREQAIMLTCQK